MKTRLQDFWDNFRNSLWYLPALLMVAATVLAYVLVRVDAHYGSQIRECFPLLNMSPSAARSILSSIVGAMVTSTGVVFSITVVALSLASSQFGSRLIRTFRNRQTNHFTLGIFVSTSYFCLLVLATVRDVNEIAFVPTISVVTAIALTTLCLATLIYYIDDMSRAIQAPNIIESSASDLDRAVDRIFPENIGDPVDADDVGDFRLNEDHEPVLTINSNKIGYVLSINQEDLLEFAKDEDLVVELLCHPGDFVYENVAVAKIYLSEPPSRKKQDRSKANGRNSADNGWRVEMKKAVRATLNIDAERTPTQDLRYAFNEVTEIAIRALSPGINDPFTAINCIDRLESALAMLLSRRLPSAYRLDHDEQLRVIARSVTFEVCFNTSLRNIFDHGSRTPMVVDQLRAAAQRLLPQIKVGKHRVVIEEFIEMLNQ